MKHFIDFSYLTVTMRTRVRAAARACARENRRKKIRGTTLVNALQKNYSTHERLCSKHGKGGFPRTA